MAMYKLCIPTQPPYEVQIGRNVLSLLADQLKEMFQERRLCLVTDSNVAPLYLDTLRQLLETNYFPCSVFVFPAGESSKNLATYGELLSFMAREQLSRNDVILALGGGTVGDLAGFAAASYMRGIPWVFLPSTLLAAVDASVGGKTAVNLPEGKNLLGAFHQPSLVFCECSFLESLGKEQIQDGLAEILKHGLIADAALFQRFQQPFSLLSEDLPELILRNVEIKSHFVLADEKDQGQRQILNFGHSIAHAIEKCSGYSISHGQAVAIGMLAEIRAAHRMGLSSFPETAIRAVLSRQGLPLSCPFSAEEIWQAARNDKKRRGQQISLVLLSCLGEAHLQELNLDDFREFVQLGMEDRE
ncbi:MAG: 3-dehydroquinate synthase [Bacillota bacterium]|nr:3-dehydroquinate synthase [Bacillota bacterium]